MSALERARRFPVTALAHPGVRKGLIGFLTFLALLAATAFHALPRPLEVRPGQIAPRDIEAPRTVEYVDEVQTAARRRLAAAAVEPVYRPAPAATASARTAVRRVFDALLRLQTAGHRTVLERRAALREQVGVTLDPEAVAAGLSLDPAVLRQAQRAAEEVVVEVMAEGVRLDQLDDARARVRRMLQASGLRGRALTVASAVGQAAVRPNLFADQAATRALRREAAEAVQPVRVRVLRGEVIVRRGDRITEEHMQRLAALGLLGAPTGWETVLGSAAVIALLLAVTAVYLVEYQREIWRVDRHLLLWSLVVVLTAVVARAVIASRYNVYLIPAAVGPILLATLLQPRLALLTSAVLALLLGLMGGGDYRLAVVAFVGGMVGVYAIRRINHRTDLVVAGLKVGLATAATVGAVGLFERHPLYPRLVTDAAFGMANGLLVGVMSIGLLPYLENLFGLVTPIKLLELSNPGHPLLRRLQLEAPGTYHHSIIVANLAEAAAEAIGADPLLVRVGTYYHDVGKIRRPVFFRENQIGVENPHERMSPSLSALVVAAHVKDGLELAREYRLPRVIADFIPQHHGTTLIAYFYHRARQRGDEPEAATYRYEGPKPQSRETAIVMLADGAEAAVRSLQRPTPDRIYEVVRSIIRDRLEDGQLDECDLTFRDLERIAQAFTRILTGIFHPRIEYPELERDVTMRRQRLARIR
ncbi:MAG: HDIG domain-containing protein [Armatimonadota bacterium]|nr:HDIG domain-containing protein [Armatimonadota bacterium]